MKFNENKKLAVSATIDEMVVWDIENKAAIKTLSGNFPVFFRITFIEDDKYLAYADNLGDIKVWSRYQENKYWTRIHLIKKWLDENQNLKSELADYLF